MLGQSVKVLLLKWHMVLQGVLLIHGRYLPGTPEFNQALADVTSRPIPGDQNGVGAKFVDKTNLYHYEGSYSFQGHQVC
jgi:hypothetical protein